MAVDSSRSGPRQTCERPTLLEVPESLEFNLTQKKPYDPAGLVESPKSPETRKSETITKEAQNPPPRVGPQKSEKNTEKIQKMSLLGRFRVFLYFFSDF